MSACPGPAVCEVVAAGDQDKKSCSGQQKRAAYRLDTAAEERAQAFDDERRRRGDGQGG